MPYSVGVYTLTAIGIAILLGGGWLAYQNRESLTSYHIAAVLLVLIGASSFVGLAGGLHDVNKVNYEVQECGTDHLTTPRAQDDIRAYEALSADSQAIFRRALQSDGTYRTTVRPDDLTYMTDQVGPAHRNFVRYQNTCYALSAALGGPGEGLGSALVLGPLGGIGLLFSAIGLNGFTTNRPVKSMALLAGTIPLAVFLLVVMRWPEWLSALNIGIVLLVGLVAGGATFWAFRRDERDQ